MENPFDEQYGDEVKETVKVTKKAKEIEKEEDFFEAVDPKLARKHELKSSLALTLGIISVVTCTFWYLFIPTGIIAIVFGHHSYVESGHKSAKAGFVLGIIGLALGLVIYLPLIGLLLTEL